MPTTDAATVATVEGIDDYASGLHGLKEIVKVAETQQVIADGDEVCIIYDLVTNTDAGAIPTAGWYHVRDGKIETIRAYFDPRPLLRD